MNCTFYGGHVHCLTALPLTFNGAHIHCGETLLFSFPLARSWLESSHFTLGRDHDNLNRLASSLIKRLSPYQEDMWSNPRRDRTWQADIVRQPFNLPGPSWHFLPLPFKHSFSCNAVSTTENCKLLSLRNHLTSGSILCIEKFQTRLSFEEKL
jgi:hypothetical protein